MVRGNTHQATNVREWKNGRESARELLRRPAVQGLLALAAGLQFAAGPGLAAERRQAAMEPVVAAKLAPVVVQPAAPSVSEIWQARATEQEVDRLTAKYRDEGYKLTPELARTILAAAKENGIELDIAFGLVRAESSFRNTATSPVGAVGLTQLMPATARWMEPGVTRAALRDPETNLRVGFKYLRHLMEKYDGNASLALLAYNRGPGTVDRALKRGRNPDNGYADFVRGKKNHGHTLYSKR